MKKIKWLAVLFYIFLPVNKKFPIIPARMNHLLPDSGNGSLLISAILLLKILVWQGV